MAFEIYKLLEENVDGYQVNDTTDTTASTYYVGKENIYGKWYIMKVVTGGGYQMRIASQKNNATYGNYTDAWTAKATLTYGILSTAF